MRVADHLRTDFRWTGPRGFAPVAPYAEDFPADAHGPGPSVCQLFAHRTGEEYARPAAGRYRFALTPPADACDLVLLVARECRFDQTYQRARALVYAAGLPATGRWLLDRLIAATTRTGLVYTWGVGTGGAPLLVAANYPYDNPADVDWLTHAVIYPSLALEAPGPVTWCFSHREDLLRVTRPRRR